MGNGESKFRKEHPELMEKLEKQARKEKMRKKVKEAKAEQRLRKRFGEGAVEDLRERREEAEKSVEEAKMRMGVQKGNVSKEELYEVARNK